VGELISITYRGTGAQFLVMTLLFQAPDGTTRPVFVNQSVLGGQTYAITGRAGLPAGMRRLILQSSGGGQATCEYNVNP
jgi:hypothetical protein